MDATSAKEKNVTLQVRQVRIKGKVVRVRRYEQWTYTTVICPAVDEYSRPSVVEIRGDRKFADKDAIVDVICTLGGFEGKSYTARDKDGVVVTLTPVNMFLDFVDEV